MLSQRFWLFGAMWLVISPWLVQAQQSTVRVGVYDNPPKLMLKDGELSGIHGELLLEIAAQHDWQLAVQSCQWQQCLQWLEQGKIDLLPDVAKNDKRLQRFEFHQEPALLSWSQLYSARGQSIASLLDLDGKSVAVLADSVQESYLKNMVQNFGLEVDFLSVNSFAEGFEALAQGRVDAVATNQFYGNQQAAAAVAEITPIMFLPNELYFSIGSPANRPLLSAIDNSLVTLKADPDSAYYAIIERWNAQPVDARLPYWIWGLVVSLILISLVSLAFVRLLNRAVKRKTRDVIDSEHKLETILGSVDAYIFIKGIDLSYDYVNAKVAELFGRQAKDIVGLTDFDLFDIETAQQITDNDKEVLQTGRRLARHELNRVPGQDHRLAFWSVKVPLKNSHGKIVGLCGISTDISEYEELKKQIEELAFFDVLTGLANRRMLLEKVNHHYHGNGNDNFSALVLIDIDKFKTVNDALGHDQGDELLRQVANRVESLLQPGEMAGRLASDEFFVLIEDLPDEHQQRQQQVQQRLQALQRQLAHSYTLGTDEHVVSLCYAVSFFEEADNAEHLLKAIDLAMTQAKLAGPSSVQFYNADLQQNFNRQQLVEAGLRQAIKKQQLAVYLQPQFEQRRDDNFCFGFEALLRWHDDKLGPVSPAEFIPVAEASGLMPALHTYVLNTSVDAIEQLHQHPSYRDCTVAINISASQFKQKHFHDELAAVVKQRPAAKFIELELTESLLVQDIEATAEIMDSLTAQGFAFALDDFGTGYSALGYLKRLPLKQLKIDQSFVRDLMQDRNDAAIVATIIALAESLGLTVLAEGVEQISQQDQLASMGCMRYQGFLLGKPEPLEHWLAQ